MSKNTTNLIIGVGLLGLAYVLYKGGKGLSDGVSSAVSATVDSVNPASQGNILYRTINAVGDIVGDGDNNNSFSLGAWIYNITHRDETRAAADDYQTQENDVVEGIGEY